MLLLVMRFEDPASLQAWSSASLLAFLAFLALLGVQRAASQAARKKRGPHHLMKRPASFGQGLSGDLSDEEAERCGPCLRKMPRGAGGLPWFVGGAAVSFIGATYEPLPNRGDPEHLGEWSPAEIRDWVESQSLRHVPAEALMHYAELFLAQGISGHSLVAGSWKAADVAKLGVPLGPAISLAERIDSLVEAARAAAADDDDDDGGGGGGFQADKSFQESFNESLNLSRSLEYATPKVEEATSGAAQPWPPLPSPHPQKPQPRRAGSFLGNTGVELPPLEENASGASSGAADGQSFSWQQQNQNPAIDGPGEISPQPPFF
mmetsp:Transcript_45972/g.103842  ORF Transcript_45972/g.103842 Transcript_45972/m.103842 type:complete len:320 (+) Transcript_45972:336-1295(+)